MNKMAYILGQKLAEECIKTGQFWSGVGNIANTAWKGVKGMASNASAGVSNVGRGLSMIGKNVPGSQAAQYGVNQLGQGFKQLAPAAIGVGGLGYLGSKAFSSPQHAKGPSFTIGR